MAGAIGETGEIIVGVIKVKDASAARICRQRYSPLPVIIAIGYAGRGWRGGAARGADLPRHIPQRVVGKGGFVLVGSGVIVGIGDGLRVAVGIEIAERGGMTERIRDLRQQAVAAGSSAIVVGVGRGMAQPVFDRTQVFVGVIGERCAMVVGIGIRAGIQRVADDQRLIMVRLGVGRLVKVGVFAPARIAVAVETAPCPRVTALVRNLRQISIRIPRKVGVLGERIDDAGDLAAGIGDCVDIAVGIGDVAVVMPASRRVTETRLIAQRVFDPRDAVVGVITHCPRVTIGRGSRIASGRREAGEIVITIVGKLPFVGVAVSGERGQANRTQIVIAVISHRPGVAVTIRHRGDLTTGIVCDGNAPAGGIGNARHIVTGIITQRNRVAIGVFDRAAVEVVTGVARNEVIDDLVLGRHIPGAVRILNETVMKDGVIGPCSIHVLGEVMLGVIGQEENHPA